MQSISAALTAQLLTIDARLTPRVLVDLYEMYESDYVPGVSGFDPNDAIESFAAETITWNGNAYRREVVSRGDITRNMGEKTNQCTLSFSNISRYMATLATTQQIEGLFLVIRTVVPSVTDDSIVLFVGRCDKPSDIDKEKFTLNARQDFGNINVEIPPREFTAEDPNGRTPSDPLYEGFRIIATNGVFPIAVTTPSTSFFGRLFGRQNSSTQTRQWSSLDSTPYGSAVPMIFGRCQMELVPIFFADIGYNLIGIWVIGEGRIEETMPVIIRDPNLTKQTDEPHLGDPGGTGTNAITVSGPINHGYLSKTAYVAVSMYGSAGDTIDDPPLITAIVKGEQVPLPNSSGVYGAAGWSDNPVNIARFVLSDPRLVGIDEGFMEDAVNYQTGLHCDEPIFDDSNGEITALMQADLAQAGTGIKRVRSTGIIDANSIKYYDLVSVEASPTYQNLTNTTSGANGSITKTSGANNDYNAGASYVTPVTTGQSAYIQVIRGTGFAAAGFFSTASPTGSGEQTTGMIFGVAWHNAGPFYTEINGDGTAQGSTVIGDEFTIEVSSERFRLYKNGVEVTSFGAASIPAQPANMWMGVIMYTTGAGVSDAKVLITSTPEYVPPPFVPIPSDDVPTTFAITRFLRKRYTCNVPLTEKMRAVDFLYKVVFPSAKLFLRINKRGKYEIRSEKPSDATMIYANTAVGATSIKVSNVVPWKSGDLLQGRIHLGFGLTTSEVRDVSSATYTADGNSITLAASKTGTITVTASGANLTGGSSTVQASGTITVGGTPAAGNTITATINSVAVTYTLTADDTTGTTAAMLAAFINATPRLSRYIRATWTSAAPTVVTITYLAGVLNVTPALLKAHTAPIADPTTTPVLADSAGTLEAGTYKVAYSDVTALGKTALSPVASRTIAASKQIDVGAIALVGTSRNWYMSDASNSEYLKFAVNTNGSAFSLTALPLPGAAIAPQYNTTGEEVIRVAMSFATNSQDVYAIWPASTLLVLNDIYLPSTPNGHKYQVSTAGTTGATEPTWPLTAGGTVASGTAVFTEIGATVLGQAGLTRANIKKDTFSYPLGSRQSSVNQVKISYRDSNNDFARTPFRVNDPIHQATVNKIYPMEVNGEAIDNFHQMFRIANWQLAKNREGDWFNTLATGPQGLVLEEGDVICASDDSGGLVNQVTRIEELRIHPNHDVTIGQARKYSTNMFSDDVGADVVPVPTTLRYVQTVDTLVEFIDNHPHRDEWGLTAGFGVVMSRDLNDEGDWRGATLYADYGDGYLPIASTDIPAIIGEATTTLGTVTDPSVWDRTNSVTFTLKYGAPAPSPLPFDSVPEQDLLANARKNLFLVGDEYVQAATVVFNGSQSYTISDLLRGRFGTDGLQLTHGASERVVFLDGSEQLVPIDITRLNGAFNYKAVTTNQDVADATPVSFTWTGGNLRPLSPVNLRGTRDTEGNLLIRWTRRGRLAPGLTPGSDVPIGEEAENYVVEIYTTGDVLKRTMNVTTGGSRPAILLPTPQLFPELISGNNILASGDNRVGTAYASQSLTGSGGWVEATFNNPDDSFVNFYLIPFDQVSKVFTGNFSGQTYRVVFNHTNTLLPTLPVGLNVQVNGSTVYSSGSLGSVSSVRIRILVSGTEVRFYWDYTGPGSIPFYVSRVAPVFPLAAVGQNAGLACSIENVLIFNPEGASVMYSDDQQVEDFGSLQNPIRVRVYQVSATVGRGDYTQADL